MKYSTVLVLALVLWISGVQANDFSSFLSANASLAIVVDHEYMMQRGENILANAERIMSDILREHIKNGGINVKYFTWNAARLKKDFIAAITVTNCEGTWQFYEATQATSVLLIALTDANCPRLPLDRALMIPIVDNGEEFPQIMLDVKTQHLLKWKTAVVLMDETILHDNYLLMESIFHESAKKGMTPISLLLYKVDNSLRGQRKRAAIRNLLLPFSRDKFKHQQFIVFSNFHNDIIEVAANLGMFHIYNQWLFFILEETQRDFDISTVTDSLEEGVNIAFALNETLPECQFTLNCTITEVSMAFVTAISRIIDEEQSIYGEISDEEWESIRLTKQEKQDEILNYMKGYLKENAKCSSCARWRIESSLTWGKNKENVKAAAFKMSNNMNFEFIKTGYWTPIVGFVTQELIFPHMEHYFRNITMNIITVHNPPWQILKRNEHGEIVEHSGIVLEIIKELSRNLNFTYKLHEVKLSDDEPTNPVNSNESDALVGSLTNTIPSQVIDLIQGTQQNYFLGAVAVTIDEPYKKLFNYSIPISIQKYSFITRKPDEVSRIYLFTAPFTVETWGCLITVVLITAPVLYLINRWMPMQHLRTKGLCNIKNCFWYIYGALLQQSGIYLPKADSGRLVIGIWWIVVIVLVTTYCGNLVAFLTFPKLQPGIDYLFQLFKQNKIRQFGLRNGTFFEKYVASTTRDDFIKYMERAVIYNNLPTEDITAVENGVRVNIDWRINLQLIIQNHFEKSRECRFTLGKENFIDEQIGIIIPMNSPYIHLINEKIIRMFQMGFIERWHQMNLPSMDKCNGRSIMREITNHKVNMDDMQGCFLVLLLGFSFALFVAFLEFWYHRLYVAEKPDKTTYTS